MFVSLPTLFPLTCAKVLKPACKSQKDVIDALSTCPVLANVRGDSSGFVAYVWDQPSSGESMTSPHLRMPPLQAQTLALYVSGCLGLRSDVPGDMTILGGDMFVFADGGRTGLTSRFMKTLTDKVEKIGNKEAVKSKRILTIGYEQESLQRRRRTVRGWTPQLENVYIIAQPQMLNSMPTRKRKRFGEASSTNKGTLLAPVPVPRFEETWTLPWATKKDLLGPFRMPVGGRTDGGDDEEEEDEEDELPPTVQELAGQRKKRKTRAEGEEPLFYQSLKSVELWEEVLHSVCVNKAVVAFTVGDGNLLEACLKLNIPAVGFCMTPAHMSSMHERLVKKLLDLMADATSPFFSAEYAQTIPSASAPAAPTPHEPQPEVPKPGVPKPRPPKAEKKDAEEDRGEDDEESGNSE